MDKETIDSAGLSVGRNRKPQERGYGQKDTGQFDDEGFVSGISGSVALYSREMLEDISIEGEYFDEDFKMFYEDLDLCWRANRFGWKAYYVPQALAYHRRGAATHNPKAKPQFLKKFYLPHLDSDLQAHVLKNRYLTIIKNDNLGSFIVHFIFIFFFDCILWAYFILFNPKVILSLFKYKECFRRAFEKRKIIKSKIEEGEDRQ